MDWRLKAMLDSIGNSLNIQAEGETSPQQREDEDRLVNFAEKVMTAEGLL